MNTRDQQLQDYLDDRMTVEEKAAFEKALASEAELAESLAGHLRIREALREKEALPPGFYTRARAEFEGRQGSPKRKIFGLPWEAVGLVAATGLALALFVPALIRDELPVAPSLDEQAGARRTTESQSEPAADFADDEAIASDLVAGRAAIEGVAGVEQAESADSLDPREVRDRPTVVEEPKKEVKLDEVSPGRPAAPAMEKAPPPPALKRKKQRVFAPSPPAPADRDESMAEEERQAQFSASRLEQEFGKAIPATPLRADAVRLYGVITLDRAEAPKYVEVPGKARADIAGDAAAAEAAPERRGAAEGLVLIGPRDTPFSCVGITLNSLPDQHVVYLGSVGPDRPASPGGCAIYLPNDDRPIVVVDP